MITDPNEEQVMVFVFFPDDEECNPEDSLCTFLSPVKAIVDSARAWPEGLGVPLGKVLVEPQAVIRGGEFYELFIADAVQPGRELDGIVADMKTAFGKNWKSRSVQVRVESRLTLIGATAIWFPALLGSLTPKLIENAKDAG